MKRVKIWVTYPWVGVEADEIEFETSAKDEVELENNIFDEVITAIFNRGIGYDYEIEEIADGEE